MIFEYYEDKDNFAFNKEVVDLVLEAGLDEPFDWENVQYIIAGRENEELLGVVVYGLVRTERGEYPRFLHIVIRPKYKWSKKGLALMKESESFLQVKGYNRVIALITHTLNNKEMKRRYALKWGYKKYHEDSIGEYYYSELGG